MAEFGENQRISVFDEPPTDALQPADIARAVIYALEQPEHVSINEILIRPTGQAS